MNAESTWVMPVAQPPGSQVSSGPGHQPGSTDPAHNEPGLRNVTFEVDDLQAILGRLAADGYHMVGGVGQYESAWRMASVRGPEGLIVNLAQRINLRPRQTAYRARQGARTDSSRSAGG